MIRMDDGFDVKRASENARILIEDKKVVALFLSRGTPHALAVIPLLDTNGVPLIGPSTGAMVLHKPVQKHVFNVRSTYQREAEKAVDASGDDGHGRASRWSSRTIPSARMRSKAR